ncbi:MAG: 3-isopropylmalate dehydrogenase [bacterium]|nr:3-isopropylmalate dehydrogenase [bacterium]
MYKIAVIPGDGIGPEVINEGLKVLEAVAKVERFTYELQPYPFGGDYYLRTGELIPDSAFDELRKSDVIYLGAIGHPGVATGVLERGILLNLRFKLDQYINLRPIKLYAERFCPLKDKTPADIDFMVVRENTEGAYVGMGGVFKKGTPDEIAIQEDVNTRKGVERCIRYAFELTKKRNRQKNLPRRMKGTLTLCDKSNVLTFGHDLWQRVFKEVGAEYPDLKKDHAHVDAITMWFVKNPEWFDVIVTPNMFGDIITDLGAMIQGGMGIAASGNLNPQGVSMFEPIHGSAPKYTGKNMINPLATIAACGMMLDHLGETKAAERVEKAIIKSLQEGYIKNLSASPDPGTSQIGDLIAKFVT